MVGLVEPLEVRGPRSVENGLALFLLLLTNVEEEAGLLLTKLLSHAAKLRLLHTKTGPRLSGLNPQLPVLSAKTANTLSNLSRLLRSLKPQAACRFRASHTHLGLSLTELAVLLRHLARVLLCGHAKLRCALGNVCLSGSASKTHLPGLLGKLPRELGGVHAGAGGKLLNVHARLSLSNGVGRGKLLTRKAELSRLLRGRKAQLARLQTALLSKLFCR